MEFSKGSSSEILERLSSAYGVETQKQLAEKLGVSAANVSNWIQRDSVPGSAFVRCALDTKCDLAWLATGVHSNANSGSAEFSPNDIMVSGQKLLNIIVNSGGKAVLQRIIQAYGFTTQKELSNHLGISAATISTWIRRDYFPAEVVITCSLDTGMSLHWLATGRHSQNSVMFPKPIYKSSIIKIAKKSLVAGKLEGNCELVLDKNFLPDNINIKNLILITSGNKSWIVSWGLTEVSNGKWVLDIDGLIDVYNVSRRPGNKVLISGVNGDFECLVTDIKVLGVVVATLSYIG
ncbi:phage repressor protein CI [Rahnella sp. CFA14(1/10)]|uniref:phage repressor protein CI n=1 Tax=Rahnella sp. CFA14(1/10) TaxID=2511203 RepID=UPI00102045CA|nr:phage repressor protein CI [Rahnella sp. CFA14(1/10)]